MDPKNAIIDALKKALTDLGIEDARPATAFGGAPQPAVVLERPADIAHGDYSTNVALAYAKQLGKNPKALAEEIAEVLRSFQKTQDRPEGFEGRQAQNNLNLEKIEVAGPGFINFKLKEAYFIDTLREIAKNPERYGKGNSFTGKMVLVEYTQPNILKPFHIGHLMSNTLGESIARILENAGADVKHLNYQGDVGLHVAKALWGITALGADPHDVDAIGKAYAHGAQAYENDETAKWEIDEINKKVYDNDPEIRELYEIGKKTSLDRFEEIYAILGTAFDRYYLESEVFKRGIELVNEGKEKDIFKESQGAIVFPGEDYGLHTRVFITSKGLPVYEAKELALAELKAKEFPQFDISITTTAVEQEQYFQVVFKALGLLRPDLDRRFTHVAHGMMQLSGGKMSSRLGNVVTGESLISGLIAEVQERMGDRVTPDLANDVARDVGVAAIKYTVLRQALRKNIIFDEEKSLSFEGDSGPYIQYTTVRARSVVAKAKEAGIMPSFDTHPENVGLVERMLERFPEVAQRAAEEREPHHVATYLIELSSAFNSWYAHEQIINTDDALSPYRVALTDAVSNVLARGLWLLGIRVPSAM